MRSKKTLVQVRAALALSALATLITGCVDPNIGAIGIEPWPCPSNCTPENNGNFTATFESVQAEIIVDPLSINGRGYVTEPDQPLPVATPGAVYNGPEIPSPAEPAAAIVLLSLNYPSGIFSDDCQTKAALAAANGMRLTVTGNGTVTYLAAGTTGAASGGSGQGNSGPAVPVLIPVDPYPYSANIQATQITSCEVEALQIQPLPPTQPGPVAYSATSEEK